MKGSLIIVGFFVLGTICGVCHLLPFDIALCCAGRWTD